MSHPSSPLTLPPNPNPPSRTRQSLSTLHPALSLHRSESDNVNVTLSHSAINGLKEREKVKRRAASVGGAGAVGVGGSGEKGLSPRSLFRRTAKPRKSILKSSAPPSTLNTSTSLQRSSPSSLSSNTQPTSRRMPRASIARSPNERASPAKNANGEGKGVNTGSPLKRMSVGPGATAASKRGDAHTFDFGALGKGPDGGEEDDGFSSEEDDNEEATTSFSPSSSKRLNSNHTLPASLLSPSKLSPTSRKAHRRAHIAAAAALRRKSVSFAPHAHVRMFEKSLGESVTPAPAGGGGRFWGEKGREKEEGGSGSKRRQVQQGGGGSGGQHGRKSSITGIPDIQVQAPVPEPQVQQRTSARRQSATPQVKQAAVENNDEDDTASDMELESLSDPADADGDSDAETEANIDRGLGQRGAGGVAQGEGEDDEGEDMDIEGETMDFTAISMAQHEELGSAPVLGGGSIFTSASTVFGAENGAGAGSGSAAGGADIPRFSMRRTLPVASEQAPAQGSSNVYSAFSSRLAFTEEGGSQLPTLQGQGSSNSLDKENYTNGSIFASPAAAGKRAAKGRLSISSVDEEDDRTVDMDLTEIVHRQIGSPASTVSARSEGGGEDSSDSDEDEVDASRDNDEVTMDFTVITGRNVPGTAPSNAWRSAESLGYVASVPEGYSPQRGTDDGTSSSPFRGLMGQVNPFGTGARGDGSVFTLPVMQRQEGDESMEMDETVAMGGIIREDQSISTVDDEEEREHLQGREPTLSFGGPAVSRGLGASTAFSIFSNENKDAEEQTMEFTMAGGGIFSSESMAANAAPATCLSASTASQVFGQAEDAAQGQEEPAEVPTYAQPTAASEARRVSQGRDIYGASPGKAEQPVGRDMDAAKDVAKKLVFTPTQSPAQNLPARSVSPTKRALESDNNGGSQSKRVSVLPPAQTPEKERSASRRRSALYAVRSPRKSLGNIGSPVRPTTPLRSQSQLGASTSGLTVPSPLNYTGPSPSKLSRMQILVPEPEPEAEPEPEVAEPLWAQQEYSNISLGNFLEMTGIHFMTSMPAATRRKSVLNGGMPAELMNRMLAGDGERNYPLNEYAAAMHAWFHYKMYLWACRQMEEDIENSQVSFEQMSKDVAEENPMVIRDYLAASDEEKGWFEETLQNLKTNAHLVAKEKWYDWRYKLTSGLQQQIQAINHNLKEDETRISDVRKTTTDALPGLRERKLALQAELEREKASIATVTECDQTELRELKTAIAEQSGQIAAFRAEYNEQTEKLSQLQSRLADHEAQKQQIGVALAAAKRECEQRKGFTKGEAFALEQELKTLQMFQSWNLSKFSANSIELSYDNELRIMAQCKDFQPVASTMAVEMHSSERSEVSQALFDMVKGVVAEKKGNGTFQEVLRLIARLWTAAQRLRSELRTASLRYPARYSVIEAGKRFEARFTIMLASSRSKVEVVCGFDGALLASWPESIPNLSLSVEKCYGTADVDDISKLIQEQVATASADAYLMAISHCCMQVEAL